MKRPLTTKKTLSNKEGVSNFSNNKAFKIKTLEPHQPQEAPYKLTSRQRHFGRQSRKILRHGQKHRAANL